MPISEDGTITPTLQRYVTRVVLEFSYAPPDADYGQDTHEYILDTLSDGINALDEMLASEGIQPRIRVSKTPQPLPEGEEVTEGLSE